MKVLFESGDQNDGWRSYRRFVGRGDGRAWALIFDRKDDSKQHKWYRCRWIEKIGWQVDREAPIEERLMLSEIRLP